MRKIFNTLIAAFALIPVSCVNEIEKVFDETASERLNAMVLECKELLVSPEHGWLIHYYPSKDRSWGGCTYAAKFERNGDVSVTSDVARRIAGRENNEIVTSHYSIKTSMGVVLSFDTYNDYIHYWADPDIPYANKKYDGDLEYAYVSGSSGKIVFRGTKSGNMIVFTALEEDIVTTIDKIDPIHEYTEERFYDGFRIHQGTASDTKLMKVRNFNACTLGDQNLPYVFTPAGICFYEPVTIGEATFQNLMWNGDGFTSVDAVSASGESLDLMFKGELNPNYRDIGDFVGRYSLSYTELPSVLLEGAADPTTYNRKTEVEISLNATKDTLVMTGLVWPQNYNMEYKMGPYPETPFTVKIQYDPFTALCEIHTQKIGISGDTNQWWVYLLPADHYSWQTWDWYADHIALSHNNPANPDKMELTFDMDDREGGKNAFLIRRFLGPKEDVVSRGTVTKIWDISKLTKIRN